jgi:aarF domain-containing kinase
MQTDPNWTNFLFNSKTQKLELLDFGASREYPDKFIDPYIRILSAASRNDREACQDLSIQLGYLTGHESQAMLKAHITSVITLRSRFEIRRLRSTTSETKRLPRGKRFDSGDDEGEIGTTARGNIQSASKTERAFLLCARLGSRVRCREMFAKAIRKAGVH